jgi:integrase
VAVIEDLWVKDGIRRPRDGKGQRYRVRWTLPGGVERSKSFPDGKKGLAQSFKTRVENDLLHGTYTDPRAGRITLREYVISEWLPQQKKAGPLTREATERRWRIHIEPVLGDKMLSAITTSAVKGWLGGLDAAPGTVRVLMALLSSILASAVDDGRITRHPMHARSVQGPAADKRKVVPWTTGQVAGIRDAMPPRWAAMVDAGAGLGLRIGEVRGLAVGDVDFLRRRVHVRHQVQRVGGALVLAPPKGGKDRYVPLPGERGSGAVRAHPAAPAAGGHAALAGAVRQAGHGAAAVHDDQRQAGRVQQLERHRLAQCGEGGRDRAGPRQRLPRAAPHLRLAAAGRWGGRAHGLRSSRPP